MTCLQQEFKESCKVECKEKDKSCRFRSVGITAYCASHICSGEKKDVQVADISSSWEKVFEGRRSFALINKIIFFLCYYCYQNKLAELRIING